MFLKFRYRLGYESLCREVADSISWQRFCRIPFGTRVPHPTTLMKITTRCGDAAVAGLNEALLAKAAAAKLLRTDKVRADTTVVEADVGLSDRLGVAGQGDRHDGPHRGAGQGRRWRDPHPGTRPAPRGGSAGPLDRRQAAAARRAAARGGPGHGAAYHRRTGRLRRSGDARRDRGDPQRQTRAARVRAGQRKGRLHRAINDLDTVMERTERVVAQTRSRLAGVMPDRRSRLVSLHDADARPIRKGRLGKPVEFGYKAQIVDNADGVILDHNVEIGNPADAPQLAPAIERITRRTGRPPRAVTADRGYGEASVERDLHDLGVRSVAIPAQEQTQRRPPRVRTPTSLPRQGQMANRLRRPDQPHQTKLRLEPHRTHRHRRRPNLVRTRHLRPQPGQDRSADRMTAPGPEFRAPSDHEQGTHAAALPHHDEPAFFRSKCASSGSDAEQRRGYGVTERQAHGGQPVRVRPRGDARVPGSAAPGVGREPAAEAEQQSSCKGASKWPVRSMKRRLRRRY